MWRQEENSFLSGVKQNRDGWDRLTAGRRQRWEQNCCEEDTGAERGREKVSRAQRAEEKNFPFFFVVGILFSLGFLPIS